MTQTSVPANSDSSDADTTRTSGRSIDVDELRQLMASVGEARRGITAQRVVELVAVAMVPLGVSLIVLGWRGASNTILVPEQLPYLISGGLLGTAMVVGGGLLYVGSWVARLASQNREQSEALRDALAGLRDDVRSSAARAPAAESGAGDTAAAATHEANEGTATAGTATELVATPNGSMYHLPSCSVVVNRDDLRQVEDPQADGMKPCGMCEPLEETGSGN